MPLTAQVSKEASVCVDTTKPTVFPPGYTPAYAAPEVLIPECLCSEDLDAYLINGPAADVWSVAVVLYRLLTGTFPFEAQAKAGLKAPAAVKTSAQYGQWLEDMGTLLSHKAWVSNSELRVLFRRTSYASCFCAHSMQKFMFAVQRREQT